jgi:lipopolysaccharide export system protein LptA
MHESSCIHANIHASMQAWRNRTYDMLKNILFTISIFLFFVINSFAQQSEDYITVVGKKMIGKTVDGQAIREVTGDVVVTQGNIRITCNQAVQYISNNNAELIGDVILTQDSLTITTDHGFYYGFERKAESNSGVILNDKKVVLSADTGVYFFKLDKAYFRHNVKLFDTTTTLTSNILTYYKNEDRMTAKGDVKIVNKESIITADSLEHFRNSRITYAFKDVEIKNSKNNVVIYGDHLEDYAKSSYTLVDLNPLLIQVDTIYTAQQDSLENKSDNQTGSTYKLDTLVMKSLKMEAFRDSSNIFKATDSVKIVRSEFASVNDLTIYYREDQKIITKKVGENGKQPVLWYGNSQLTGDSVTIFVRDNMIRLLDIDRNAFLLSQDSMYTDRFNQLSGSRIEVEFSGGDISKTEVFGGVHSIYYMFEDHTPNGLTMSSSESAVINFENRKVSVVRLYGSPSSEYYPENKVKGKELSFTLPRYVFHKNRPVMDELLSQLNKD